MPCASSDRFHTTGSSMLGCSPDSAVGPAAASCTAQADQQTRSNTVAERIALGPFPAAGR